ncbi:MAG: hypothetical protein AB3N14_16195 [Flavobacteriaceae bacterium]
MKLRIKGNSVRIRLTKTEVAQFCEQGFYTAETNFGKTLFRYSVKAGPEADSMSAVFEAEEIAIIIPASELQNWQRDERVGFYDQINLGADEHLLLQVEKDFECLEFRGEDESDNYPNPKAQTRATNG